MNSRTIAEPGTAVAILDGLRADIAPLLAENGQSFDRLRATFLIAVQQNPEILDCTPDSLRREISKCAFDGLVPDSKEAVLLPYREKQEDGKYLLVANYQPMVYGIIKRMKELGSVFNIVCEIVCQNDTFTFNAADPDSLSHSWDVFSQTPRGDTRAAYVIFRDDQKRVMHREIMTLAELQAVRQASKAPNSPAWKNFEGEMHQKAVLRRGSKFISINNDRIRALIERQDDMFDFRQQGPASRERFNPFTGELIEGTSGLAALPAPTDAGVNVATVMPERAEPVERRGPVRQEQGPAPQMTAAPTPAEEKKPAPPPQVPAVSIEHADKAKILEGVTKLLAIGLDQSVTPKERQEQLKMAAPDWKKAVPDYAHPLIKACIDMTQWALLQQASGAPWAGDHASFVHTVKSLLEVKTLSIGKYP